MKLTPETLARLKELHEKATPDWSVDLDKDEAKVSDHSRSNWIRGHIGNRTVIVFNDGICVQRMSERIANCELTVEMRRALPDLLAAAEENIKLRAALEDLAATVWLSKYSGDLEWIKLNVQGMARAALKGKINEE